MKEQNNNLLFAVKEIITHARLQVYRAANSALLESYWKIGKLIVEDEQHGNDKAQYGKNTLKTLSQQLNREFGKGFDYTNLTNMRKFYLVSNSILDAVRQELSWTHYRLLSRLDTSERRNYYLHESIACNWNSRELQRQINTLAFERVLTHQPSKAHPVTINNLIKDPYILNF